MNLAIFFNTVLYLSLMGIVVCIFVILIKFIFKNKLSPTWHYYIWLIVILRLILPYSFSSSFSIFNMFNFSSNKITVSQNISSLNTTDVSTSTTLNNKDNSKFLQKLNNKVLKTPLINNNLTLQNKTIAKNNKICLVPYENVFSLVWLVAMSIFTIYTLIVYFNFILRIKREPICTDKIIISILTQCKTEMNIKSTVPIIYSKNVKSPCLLGIIKPKLLVPKDIIAQLSDDEKKYIFLHELGHLKRKDLLINYIFTILLFIHCFNPLLWISFIKMKQDCEISCDNLVLHHISESEHRSYGETLIKLVNILSMPKCKPFTAGIISSTQIKRRIKMIVKFKNKKVFWTIIAIAITLCACGFLLTNARENTLTSSKIKTSKPKIVSKINPNKTNTIKPAIKENNPVIQNSNKKSTAKPVVANKNITTSTTSQFLVTTSNTNNKNNASINKISDENIKNLLANGDISVKKIETIIKVSGTEVQNSNFYYKQLPEEINSYSSLKDYLNKNLNLSSYYTDNFINKFINKEFKMINGKYYVLEGDFGQDCNISSSSITNKNYSNNNLSITILATYGDETTSATLPANLVYNNDKWLIDSFDPWGIGI